MLSKACLVGIYQRKLEHIADAGIDLLTLVPPSWSDERGELRLERAYTRGYRLETLPIVRNGDYHLHFYPTLGARIRAFQPDIVHIDEEPYNLAAWQAMFYARKHGARALFFSWQNLQRRYPPPFAWGERYVLARADAAIAGTQSAADVWRAKGFARPLAVIPQFGTDPDLFQPPAAQRERPFTIGYIGRLVPEKGVSVLLDAFALLISAGKYLDADARLLIVGGGTNRAELQTHAESLGIAARVEWREQVPSTAMPGIYHEIDVLVLPSLTRPNWKEQFGRVLVEAMMSGVAVVGSDSGAIPDVIGDAGLVVPEGNVEALAVALSATRADRKRADMARRGRERALAHFTHAQIAAATVAVYRQLMA
ncbi:MAG: glycosyltransferase family 4 protein [Chloroflexota bacterium]|nr:glycosyltransferase family 4 protein [Chloroflexota bacterium]